MVDVDSRKLTSTNRAAAARARDFVCVCVCVCDCVCVCVCVVDWRGEQAGSKVQGRARDSGGTDKGRRMMAYSRQTARAAHTHMSARVPNSACSCFLFRRQLSNALWQYDLVTEMWTCLGPHPSSSSSSSPSSSSSRISSATGGAGTRHTHARNRGSEPHSSGQGGGGKLRCEVKKRSWPGPSREHTLIALNDRT